MNRRAVLRAAAAVVALVWSHVPVRRAAGGAPPVTPPSGSIVDHQGWIVRASDRDALLHPRTVAGQRD
jgi:hypothetical protein